jgi:hypothetical protein
MSPRANKVVCMLEKVDLFFRLSEDEIHTLERHATVRS